MLIFIQYQYSVMFLLFMFCFLTYSSAAAGLQRSPASNAKLEHVASAHQHSEVDFTFELQFPHTADIGPKAW